MPEQKNLPSFLELLLRCSGDPLISSEVFHLASIGSSIHSSSLPRARVGLAVTSRSGRPVPHQSVRRAPRYHFLLCPLHLDLHFPNKHPQFAFDSSNNRINVPCVLEKKKKRSEFCSRRSSFLKWFVTSILLMMLIDFYMSLLILFVCLVYQLQRKTWWKPLIVRIYW